MKRSAWILAAMLLPPLAVSCGKSKNVPLYEKVPVVRRDLVVTVSAAGDVEPVRTVDVKSKASGEIIAMRTETGADVRTGDILARIDPRLPRNTLAQAEANLDVARAKLENAQTQLKRSEALYKNQDITTSDYDNARLGFATAKAGVVQARSDLENARDQMADTQVRAPVSGTIIAKNVELGTVISSPTRDVGGGTVLFKMANLDTMQVRTLVDETDIGKIHPGLSAMITVQAYPNRPFHGRVEKIEPQAIVQQNVTMFPVLIDLENPGHLLKPGMNTEVQLNVGDRRGVLTVPNAALRTQRDVASAAQVLGLDPAQVQQQLAAAAAATAPQRDSTQTAVTATDGQPHDTAAQKLTLPNGREVDLPAGVSADQVRAAMQKRMSGAELSPAERALMRQVFAQFGGGGGGGRGGNARSSDFDTSYIVFALRQGKPTPLSIRTGLTDLDHIEVVAGLAEQDTVLVLPSASLLAQQKEFRDRFQRMTGGGLPGLQQQQQQPPRAGGTGATQTR